MSKYGSLSNEEFLNLADRMIDDLTSTDIELELIKRFSEVLSYAEYAEVAGDRTPTEVAECIEFYDSNRGLIEELHKLGVSCSGTLDELLDKQEEQRQELAVYKSAINRIKTIIEEEK
ncbi:MAG: hypothetical protein WCS37_20965 [Chloroflexota bacterium]